jgi:hypothetical protein
MKETPSRIYPWLRIPYLPKFPPINVVVDAHSNGIFTDSALVYQGILKYGLEHPGGFIFTDLGNWLIKNLLQYHEYYTGSKSHIPISTRLASRRQNHLDNLTKMELIYKGMTKARKTHEDIPSFDLTLEGRFLAWIMEAKDPNKSTDLMWTIKDKEERNSKPDAVRSKAFKEVFTIIDSFTSSEDSYILMFLNRFFVKCLRSDYFAECIDWFYYSHLRVVQMTKGQELLRLFTKIVNIQSLGANANESTLESLTANLANYPDRDPTKLIEAAAQVSESGIPLEKLEEHVKALMAEKETLQREIDEGRAILDGVDKDVESRTKLLEEYAQMKAEMRRYGIEPEDSKRFSNVLQVLQRDNYDCAKILETFADVDDVIKLRLEVDNAWGTLKTRLEEVKDTLPFAEQLLQCEVGINDVLAFKLAVDEKAIYGKHFKGSCGLQSY